MEAELVSSDHCLKLYPVNNTDFHKAWHLLGLLLTIGRPVRTIELASSCTLFQSPPELVEYLCSIPNSPLRLTGDLFVTVSSVAISAFGQFVVNSNTVTPFVHQIGLDGLMPKRIRGDVKITYCRKRRRAIPDSDGLTVIKDGTFWRNGNEEETNQIALALPYKIEDACPKAPTSMDMSRGMITQAASNWENPNQAIVTTSNEAQLSFLNYERFPHFLDAITVLGTKACITNPEISIETSTMENQVMLREANNMNDSYSRSQIDLNAPPCPEVEKPMMVSSVEAENVIYACKDIAKSAEDEREKEQVIGVENMQTNTANVNESCEDDFTAKNTVKGIFSADLLSIDHKQSTKFLATVKTVKKDSLNPTPIALSRTIENSTFGAHIDQQHKKSFSIKQKIPNNYDQKIVAKEKKESSKENREKPTSTSLKNQPEPKVLPNFESFIVKEEEGSGGYGTVYRAQRKNDGATIAIKCPHANANRHHVYNELKMLERFGGKNFVIKYEGSFKNGGSDCLVLEHVEHDRPEVLKREIDVFQLQWYGYCLFRALAGLHKQGVVHRDVKPGNFLFSRKVNKGYLIDFNLAMDLKQKYGTTDKSMAGHDAIHMKSLPPTKSRKLPTTKALELLANQEPIKGSKSLALPKNLKRKTDQLSSRKNMMKSQGADGSGITSAKEATSSRVPSGERLREPIPLQGRKELISLVQEAMQGPNHVVTSIPSSKRKRVAAPSERVESKVYFTPMPLHSTGVAIAGTGLLKNKGEGKHRREGPCVGTKGFRAPEVLFRSQHQGPKIDIWSAGVTLLYLITGRTPFVGDPDQNIKEIAKLKGSEDLWEVAKLHNRESSFPPNLFDVQFLTSTKLRDWCKLITRRPDFHETLPRSLFDLVDKCLTVNPRVRISAEEALRHEFFAPCHVLLRKQRMLRLHGLTSFDSAATSDGSLAASNKFD